jgi:phosphoenolpyruvate-protein kinase (PTS system EI component)
MDNNEELSEEKKKILAAILRLLTDPKILERLEASFEQEPESWESEHDDQRSP